MQALNITISYEFQVLPMDGIKSVSFLRTRLDGNTIRSISVFVGWSVFVFFSTCRFLLYPYSSFLFFSISCFILIIFFSLAIFSAPFHHVISSLIIFFYPITISLSFIVIFLFLHIINPFLPIPIVVFLPP